MAAVAPGHVAQVGGNVGLLARSGRIFLPALQKPIAVEFGGLIVEGRVHPDGMGRNANLCVGGNGEAICEGEIVANETLKCNCEESKSKPEEGARERTWD